MNPSTNLPVRYKGLDCRKWHCTYAMPHHMAQAHPGVSHDYAGCSEEEKTKVLQGADNFRAPLPPIACGIPPCHHRGHTVLLKPATTNQNVPILRWQPSSS